jgi:hypothetical protein
MLMFQVPDVAAARERVRALSIREVFEVELDDISEVHLHPADMRGAIVSLSSPRPAGAWRWGGPEWAQRSARGRVAGARIGVRDRESVSERWHSVLGGELPAGVSLYADAGEPGLVEIEIADGGDGEGTFEVGSVRFVVAR